MSRRNLLDGLTALTVIPTARVLTSTSNPDAVVLAACASYMEKEAAYDAAFRQQCEAAEAGTNPEKRWLGDVQSALAEEQQQPLGVIIETVATTQVGRTPKAAVALTPVQTNPKGEAMLNEDALLWSLAKGLDGKFLEPWA